MTIDLTVEPFLEIILTKYTPASLPLIFTLTVDEDILSDTTTCPIEFNTS
jgi:hypothetical protein